MKIGIVGSSMAVAGSTALAALALGAGPASAQPTPTYNSTATAKTGAVTINNTSVPLLAVTATNANSPQSATIGIGPLLTALSTVPVVGPLLESAVPSGLNVAAVDATASPTGTSTACAAVLVGTCTGTPGPVVLKLGVDALASALGVTPPTTPGLVIVLTVHGPAASCSAGPAGTGPFTADASAASVTADITENGTSILSAPVTVTSGNVWASLETAVAAQNPTLALELTPILTALATTAPLGVIVDPSTTHVATGPTATATAGELGLTLGNTTLLDVKGVDVSCGPNTLATTIAPSPPVSTSPAPTATATPTPTSTSGEQPLEQIQSDEGRSSAPVRSWLALNGMP